MLIEFRVENHRSLKTEQVLTMEAGRVDGDTTIPRTVPGYSKPLLPVAALYGANASGKSNVLSGLAFMREAVTGSFRQWGPMAGIPRDPFAWGTARGSSSMYEVMFVHRDERYQKDVRFQYGFAVSDDVVVEEWLHAWPKGKQQTWFTREGGKFSFGDSLKGERRLIQDVTGPNVLFLSVAGFHSHPQLGALWDWFSQMEVVDVPRYSEPWRGESFIYNGCVLEKQGIRLNSVPGHVSPGQVLDDFRRMLSQADVGISDFKMEEDDGKGDVWTNAPPKLFLKHNSNDDDAWLPLQQESRGTQTVFRSGPLICYVLRTGGVLLVDELEASLHPKLAVEIIKQFNNPKTNPKNAQLIFTTHDTNLLGNDAGEPVLRRDQVWLTEKDKEGATTLYPLTDYKPRKAENVERGYLQGRYGAIPYLGNFSLLGKEAT